MDFTPIFLFSGQMSSYWLGILMNVGMAIERVLFIIWEGMRYYS